MATQVEIREGETTAEQPAEETPTDRPAGLPEKFNSVEDLAKSYSELESKLGAKTEPAVETADSKAPDKQDNNLEIAEQVTAEAGLDLNELSQQFAENGKLQDSDYEALEKAGIAKNYVDSFIQGQQALAAQQRATVHNLVGGEESYKGMTDWAANNLDAGQKEAYNNAVNSGNQETVNLAVMGLKAQYEAANGMDPNLIKGKSSPTSEAGFESWAQVTAAMADERYAKDDAYRQMVQQKISNSNL